MRLKDIEPGRAFLIIDENEPERDPGAYIVVRVPGEAETPSGLIPCAHVFTGYLYAFPAIWRVAAVHLSFSITSHEPN